jgi:hypothetical protein
VVHRIILKCDNYFHDTKLSTEAGFNISVLVPYYTQFTEMVLLSRRKLKSYLNMQECAAVSVNTSRSDFISSFSAKQLYNVVQASIISRTQSTISAWGGFLQVVLSRANRSRLCNGTNSDSLLFVAIQTLMISIHHTDHCLHSILHPV